MNYRTCNEVLCKRQNWLKTRIAQASREGRFLSHDAAECEALDLAIELVEVAVCGEENEQ
jgi:hypothetical protein